MHSAATNLAIRVFCPGEMGMPGSLRAYQCRLGRGEALCRSWAIATAGAVPISPSTGVGSRLMNVAALSRDLYGFAIELRQLAYTMPGGTEDPLIRLSERMVRCASDESAER